jgi:hypothetical protein
MKKMMTMSNNKQQTALEWFWNQLPEILPFTVDTATAVKLDEAYQQAKEMERQRIIKAWKAGDGKYDKVADKLSEQYYEKTYGGNNEQ